MKENSLGRTVAGCRAAVGGDQAAGARWTFQTGARIGLV